jgi:hypothetical protein
MVAAGAAGLRSGAGTPAAPDAPAITGLRQLCLYLVVPAVGLAGVVGFAALVAGGH